MEYTWEEFKHLVEEAGVRNETKIEWISLDSDDRLPLVVVINEHRNTFTVE